MTTPVRQRPIVVWAALMLATVLTTWVLGHGIGSGETGRDVALAGTFAIAAWKVRLVMLDFMELRHAPVLGRLIFSAWALIVPVAIVIVVL